MTAPGVPGQPNDGPVYRLTQSAAIHLLGAALGCAAGLLLSALRLPWAAGVVVLASAVFAIVRIRGRTLVTATRRRLVVSGTWGEDAVSLEDVTEVRLEKDLWSTNLVVERRTGKPLRVRDLEDAAGALAVLGSLVRTARASASGRGGSLGPAWESPPVMSAAEIARLASPAPPASARREPLPAFLPPQSAAEKAAVHAKLATKAATRPIDLSFLDERDRARR